MGNLADPIACVLGNLDLVRPLSSAGIPCAVPAGRGVVSHSRFVSHLIDLPPGGGPHTVAALVAFGQSRPEPPVLFYQSDADLLLVSRNRAALGAALRFVVADANLVEQLTDKHAWITLADDLRLPVPPAVALNGSDAPPASLRFPLVLKLASHEKGLRLIPGSLAKAIAVRSREELERSLRAIEAVGATVIAQEWVPGPESAMESYHVYVDSEGQRVAEFTGRKIRTLPRRFGASTAIEVTDIPDVRALGREIVDRLGLTGVAKLDMKRDPEGRLWLLEVNARFTLWHHAGAAAGVNIPALVWADLTGRRRPAVREHPRRVTWWSVDDLRAGRAQGVRPASLLKFAALATVRSGLSLDDLGPILHGALERSRSKFARATRVEGVGQPHG